MQFMINAFWQQQSLPLPRKYSSTAVKWANRHQCPRHGLRPRSHWVEVVALVAGRAAFSCTTLSRSVTDQSASSIWDSNRHSVIKQDGLILQISSTTWQQKCNPVGSMLWKYKRTAEGKCCAVKTNAKHIRSASQDTFNIPLRSNMTKYFHHYLKTYSLTYGQDSTKFFCVHRLVC